MPFDAEQRGILRGSALALMFAVAVISAGYAWLPARWFGLNDAMTMGDQIAFALKTDLPLFIWLAWSVRAVSSRRFRSPIDRKGAAFGPSSEEIAIPRALLQNSLEQTVLAVGAHLVLATVLRGAELVVIPLLVALYLLGRVSFSLRYSRGAAQRSFGMALTASPSVASYVVAAGLILVGR